MKNRRSKTGVIFTTEEARSQARGYRARAIIVANAARWEIPDYCCVDIDIFNINMDRDNVMKPVHDALEGVIYVNDRRILDGRVRRFKDRSGPRIVLTIQSVDGPAYGFNRTPVRGVPSSKPARLRQPRKPRGAVVPTHIQALLDRDAVRDRPLPNGDENCR